MQLLSEADSGGVRLALRRFLHAEAVGCDFIGYFAQKGEGIWWATLEGAPRSNAAEVISEQVQQAERVQEAAGIILPGISSDGQLRDLVATLDSSPLWHVEREQVQRNGIATEIVRVCWLNSTGEKCSVLGMAPILTMPATRRAPYVSLFVWPGPCANEFRKKPFPEIGIGDMRPPPIDRDAYDLMRKKTEARSRQLNAGELPKNATYILPA